MHCLKGIPLFFLVASQCRFDHPPLKEIFIEGYLDKISSGPLGYRQSRWFKLTPDELSYTENQYTPPTQRTVYPFSDISTVSAQDSTRFNVSLVNGKVLKLQAPNQKSKNAWVEALAKSLYSIRISPSNGAVLVQKATEQPPRTPKSPPEPTQSFHQHYFPHSNTSSRPHTRGAREDAGGPLERLGREVDRCCNGPTTTARALLILIRTTVLVFSLSFVIFFTGPCINIHR